MRALERFDESEGDSLSSPSSLPPDEETFGNNGEEWWSEPRGGENRADEEGDDETLPNLLDGSEEIDIDGGGDVLPGLLPAPKLWRDDNHMDGDK